MPEPRSLSLILASYRCLLRLLPRRDAAHREATVGLARQMLLEQWSAEGGRGLARAALGCHLDALRQAFGRRRSTGARASPLDGLRQDLRFAVRGALARPGFTLITLSTLALGIGANAAIFSVAHTVLQRPLPFRDDHRVVRVYQMRNGQRPWLSPRADVYLAVAEQGDFFDSIVGQRYTSLTLATPEGPVRVAAMGITSGWLETLGIEMHAGRAFTAAETAAGREAGVVAVSHAFWQLRHGGDPALLRSTIVVDDAPWTVVGILPPGFAYPYSNELYFPLNPRLAPTGRWAFNIQARLRDGVTVERARAALEAMSEQLRGRLDSFGPEMVLTAIPLRQVLTNEGEPLVGGLMVAVGFVLLIACANVASLLLARSLSRRREMAIRAALGAGRARQVRQVLTESLLLAVLGGAGGLLLAAWTRDALGALVPGRLGNVLDGIPLDGVVLGFALVASLGTGLLFGLPLALRVSSSEPGTLLRTGTRGTGDRLQHRMLDAFVVGELALVLVLMTGAALMVGNLMGLAATDLGYEPEGVLTLRVSLESERYGEPGVRLVFASRVVEELRAIPGVRDAGGTTMYPWANAGFLAGLISEGGDPFDAGVLQVNERHVTPGFLETLGMPLLAGRYLDAADGPDTAPVAVLSRSVAERLWPGDEAVGRTLRERGAEDREVTVVGVVEDVLEFTGADGAWYLPYTQGATEGSAAALVLTVRAAALSPELIAAVRAAVWRVDTSLPVFEVHSAADLYGQTLRDERLGTALLAGFAGFGLVLAAVGLYGVIALAVGARTRELGVRLALGARPADLLAGVLRDGLKRGLLGLGIGLVGAVGLARLMRAVVSEIDPLHPGILTVVSAVLLAVCLTASLLPALRATRLDPALTLRAE